MLICKRYEFTALEGRTPEDAMGAALQDLEAQGDVDILGTSIIRPQSGRFALYELYVVLRAADDVALKISRRR